MMDEIVFTITGGGPKRAWWVGEGKWWLMIEGFGLVHASAPVQGTY